VEAVDEELCVFEELWLAAEETVMRVAPVVVHEAQMQRGGEASVQHLEDCLRALSLRHE
jgi:hypothetical protein